MKSLQQQILHSVELNYRSQLSHLHRDLIIQNHDRLRLYLGLQLQLQIAKLPIKLQRKSLLMILMKACQ